jgi:molecular chaperone GrpE
MIFNYKLRVAVLLHFKGNLSKSPSMKKDDELSPQLQKIQSLETEIEGLQKKIEEAEGARMRAFADLQNAQRREAENKKNWVSLGIAEFIKQLLPRLVELRLGAEHSSDTDMKKVVKHLFEELKKTGLHSIEPKKGEAIDPQCHEVLMAEEGPAGTVIKTLHPGWKLGDIVLSPAKISGAKS